MELKTRRWIHGLLFVIGLVMMVGGTATRKHGATIIGLIVAAINLQQWLAWERRRTAAGRNSPRS